MKFFWMTAFLLLGGEAWAGSDFYKSDAGLGFEVPSDSYVVEREIFADSHSKSLGTVWVLKVLSRGVSEEAALGWHARAQVEVFEPTPWKDPSLWASSMGRSWKSQDRWIRVGGQDALSLEILDASGKVGSREVFLVREERGFLISSREPALLERLLKTIQFGEPRRLKRQGPNMRAGESSLDTPRVRMVYLVPSDRQPDKKYLEGMARSIQELQGFYGSQLKGKSFSLHDPVVELFRTGHPVSWYTTDAPASSNAGRFWESVLNDGFALTQGRFDDPSNRWIFYIDADPICDQYQGGTNGVALVSANDLRGVTCRQNIPVCGGDPDNSGLCRWVGGLGHELGHSFNLPHPAVGTCPGGDPGCDHALMWLGYIVFPDAYLLPSDKSSLLESPSTRDFFAERPRLPVRSCTTGCTGN